MVLTRFLRSHRCRGNGVREELRHSVQVVARPGSVECLEESVAYSIGRLTECSGGLPSNNSPLGAFSTKGWPERRDRELPQYNTVGDDFEHYRRNHLLVLQARARVQVVLLYVLEYFPDYARVGVVLGGITRVSCLHIYIVLGNGNNNSGACYTDVKYLHKCF